MYSNDSHSGVRPRGRHIAHWLVRYDGATLGPVTLSRLEEWIRGGLVPRRAELGLVGSDDWVPLRRALPCVKPEIPTEDPLEPASMSFFDEDEEDTQVRQARGTTTRQPAQPAHAQPAQPSTRQGAARWKQTVVGWSPPGR